MHVKWLKWT